MPPYRPPFANSSSSVPTPPFVLSTPPSAPNPSHVAGTSSRNAIDLTRSPSPSPFSRPSSQMLVAQQPIASTSQNDPQAALKDISPKTPVCIGQLTIAALILYPTDYLNPPSQGNPAVEEEWVPVRLNHDRTTRPGGEDTIHIRTPNKKNANGDSMLGEDFGVVEQKVASALGPMMGKGLIRLDAKMKRGYQNVPILSLEALVYTPKGNIPVVGNYLRQYGLLLDHPRPQMCSAPYCNPHNPPPGGFSRHLQSARTGYSGPGGNNGRWSTSGKSVEVQRSQVDELFKSLRSGDELDESEPPPEVGTKLYPHQKRALTFLLEREREICAKDGGRSSLWQSRSNPISGQTTWSHLVTQKDVFEEPDESKGAILADDMGLGKTITCVSLIAATLQSARTFEKSPLVLPKGPFDSRSRSASSSALNAAHFAGSVYGMPDTSSPLTAKARAKEAKLLDQAEAQYARARRIKFKSRATLVICPLSTVSNWEEQFREHWSGPVQVTGGSGNCSLPPDHSGSSQPAGTQDLSQCMPGSREVTEPPKLEPVGQAYAGLRVYVYHGNARRPDPAFLADCDVVITTYSTLASEFSKQSRSTSVAEDGEDRSGDSGAEASGGDRPTKAKKAGKRKRNFNGIEATSPLQSVHWFRVVLDEAHSIKELNTVACRASCDLLADRRLCLTGTPVQNKLDDVFALVKFLKLDPMDDKATWTEFIGTPVKYGQPLGIARLQTIMKCITLRRTKESKAANGTRILSLPPRRDELRYLKFDPEEQELYDRFFNESRAEFRELSHKNEVMKNYVGILQKILRLRQICDDLELVKGKGILADQQVSYEDTVTAITNEGITVPRAAVIFALLREAATTQCAECGTEFCPAGSDLQELGTGGDGDVTPVAKKGRKPKAIAQRGAACSDAASPAGAPRPILTRCQHLLCMCCFKRGVDMAWPDCPPDLARPCPVCQFILLPTDAVEVDPNYVAPDHAAKAKVSRRERKLKGIQMDDFRPSTKVKALMNDLTQFSRANPYSINYDPNSLEVQMVDDHGNILDDGITKTVVFSQWTSMLDRVEDALDASGIRYDRLDGTMKREDRSRAMEALKTDPGCEVLLVSLKAGGVGLNLTAAQRVYLMDPYWNPAVENQAVDRIHRLGQTKPVTTVKLIIENSIEARLLEVQRKKTELANMTLGQISKGELVQRRIEELNQLFRR
ncbi:hypothetical protein FA95DRAFT_1517532 [Auriscalpium vulgare]|uniref:Uncharacterized protein n=1 Tax=Auriscalpium vulgare TaxID=40419 RepID=A0ACB8RWR2_9AGAM|nr:hypothetical protein FA95DRAFT_1517532 [Auriscalpium vulgare]